MAIISKIRNRAGLLIGIVGISLLAFVLGDLLTSNRSFIGQTNDVGKIAGETVSVQDFEQRYEQMVENYKINNNATALDQATLDQLREQTWNQFVNERVYGKEIQKLGIVVPQEEILDMVQGKYVHPQIKQAFTDPNTNEFNPANVIQFLKNLDEDGTGKTRAQWLQFENYLVDERLQQKYNEMIKKGLYVTTFEAQKDYEAQNRQSSLKYLMINYNTVPDSTIAFSENDLKVYYDKNKDQYKQEQTRKIEYVTFDVTPSEEDLGVATESLTKLAEDFRNAENDSMFVARNSENAEAPRFYKYDELPADVRDRVFSANTGEVIGPFTEGLSHKLIKVLDVAQRPDSVKARHILLKVPENGNADSVKAVADSLKSVIRRNKNFESLAKDLSQDFASGSKGGDLGWFAEGMMVPEFNDASFEGKVGDMPIVQTQFGVHLIEITGRGEDSKRVKAATIEKTLSPGNRTYQSFFAKANEFASNNRSGEDFDKTVAEQGLQKKVADNLKETDRTILGLDSPRELIRWAYTADEGEVSKVFEIGDKYVVAHLIDVREKGHSTLDQVREAVTAQVRKEKKGDQFIEKIKATGASDVEGIAAALNVLAQNAENLNFAGGAIPGVGRELNVVGIAATLNKGENSNPIKGDNGVFVIRVENITEPQPKQDYIAEKDQVIQQIGPRAEFDSFNALKEKADITDNRGKFF